MVLLLWLGLLLGGLTKVEGKVAEVRCVLDGVEAAEELVLDEGGAAAEAVGLDGLALLGLDHVLQL